MSIRVYERVYFLAGTVLNQESSADDPRIELQLMYEPETASSHATALIDAICEGDTSAWCFLPVEQSEAARCSRPFRVLWNLPPVVSDSGGTFSQKLLAGTFETMGISAEDFFDRVTMHRTEVPVEFQLLRNDNTRILVSLQCVFSNINGAVIGRLLHFSVLSDSNAIAGLIDRISAARKQLQVLTKRETEIANLVYEGRTNKSISITTGISEKTVEKHRSRIMLKLGLNSTTLVIRLITVARMLSSPQWDRVE